jgi:hypothetical protein
MLSQIFFLKIIQLSTSTKPILKEVFIKYIENKVAQLLDNVIIKGNYIFWLILNDGKIYLWKKNHVTICYKMEIYF